MGAKGKKNLSKKEFANIKLFQKAGLSTKQIADVTSRSKGTIGVVSHFDDIEAYREHNRQRGLKALKPANEVVQKASPHEDISLVLEKLGAIGYCMNQLLDIIKDKEAKANVAFWKR